MPFLYTNRQPRASDGKDYAYTVYEFGDGQTVYRATEFREMIEGLCEPMEKFQEVQVRPIHFWKATLIDYNAWYAQHRPLAMLANKHYQYLVKQQQKSEEGLT